MLSGIRSRIDGYTKPLGGNFNLTPNIHENLIKSVYFLNFSIMK